MTLQTLFEEGENHLQGQLEALNPGFQAPRFVQFPLAGLRLDFFQLETT